MYGLNVLKYVNQHDIAPVYLISHVKFGKPHLTVMFCLQDLALIS
jgi:hypothetical protein